MNSLYVFFGGLDTKIMFLLKKLLSYVQISLFASFAPRVKLWEFRCTPKHQPIVKKF